MPSNTTPDDSVDDVAHGATSNRESLPQRLVTHGTRLFGATRRSRSGGTNTPTGDLTTASWSARQRVLRAYHADNLTKARHCSEQLVRAGFNTGDIPYGYRPQRVRVCPPGRRPRWRTRLRIEPVEASTVRMIFVWRGEDRLHTRQILRRLTESRYPAPLDPDTGQPSMWTLAVVRAILRNPKYLGRQVWGRTRHGKRAPREQWVWSDVWVHPPLITAEEFAAANPHLRFQEPATAVTAA
ncbi:recombinase family protein [Lentzea sp. NPDC051213]|uniref:recombinase family protein n=1 Tax=Lentzea sp. NPDC051213 TaxID=3364126 RepID=UPI00379A50FA